ncbi:MAG: hypothetical protein PVJ66_02890 [Gammaproteobacteria bacterium]
MGEAQYLPLWYTRRDGIVRGPFNAEYITRYILLGRIRLNDELSQDRINWSAAVNFSEFLSPELASLSSWEDYQQLVVARMQADERKAERRLRNTDDWRQHHPERRTRPDRRRGDNNLLVSQYLFSDAVSPVARKIQSMRGRTLLLSLVLVFLVFVVLLPSQV